MKKSIKHDEEDCFADVSTKDLEILRGRHAMVPERVVDFMLQHELKKARRKAKGTPRGELLKKTLIVSHNFYAYIVEQLNRTDPAGPDPTDPCEVDYVVSDSYSTNKDVHGHLHDPWFYRRIMFPCYVHNTHWILIVWNFPRVYGKTYLGYHGKKGLFPNVRIYDSIHDDDYAHTAWNRIEREFLEHIPYVQTYLAKGHPRWPHPDAEHLTLEDRMKVPTQRDHTNCAFYVIQMAKSLLYGRNAKDYYNAPKRDDNLHWTKFHAREIRPAEIPLLQQYRNERAIHKAKIDIKKCKWAKKIERGF
jgi:hypothetical protein